MPREFVGGVRAFAVLVVEITPLLAFHLFPKLRRRQVAQVLFNIDIDLLLAELLKREREMVRIACVGETVKNDPTGAATRKRYEEIKDAVSRKIPIMNNFEENKGAWPREKDWWASLKDGKAHWATGFRGEVMEAILEIRAESETAGSYSLIVDNMQRMQDFNRAGNQQDKAVF